MKCLTQTAYLSTTTGIEKGLFQSRVAEHSKVSGLTVVLDMTQLASRLFPTLGLTAVASGHQAVLMRLEALFCLQQEPSSLPGQESGLSCWQVPVLSPLVRSGAEGASWTLPWPSWSGCRGRFCRSDRITLPPALRPFLGMSSCAEN